MKTKVKISASAAVQYAMASGSMQQISSYLERGRSLKNLTQLDLSSLLVRALHSWMAYFPSAEHRRPFDDVTAEYEMRHLEPPFHLIQADIEKLESQIEVGLEKLDKQDRHQIKRKIVDNYIKAKARSN